MVVVVVVVVVEQDAARWLQSAGLSASAVTDAGSGLFAVLWWLLSPLVMLWNVIVGFVFASPPQSYDGEQQRASPPHQRGTSDPDTAPDASVRRRVPGYVAFIRRSFVKRFALCYRVVVCLAVSVCDVGVLSPNGWMD